MTLTIPVHVVYVLDHPERGVIYVGCTNNFDRRWREHSRRPEFAGSIMRAVHSTPDRIAAEVHESRLIRTIRPRYNKTVPANPSHYATVEHNSMPFRLAFNMFERLAMASS